MRADPAHVLSTPSSVGAELVRTDRGGDVTYHGPGQLVLYPVVDVDDGPGAGPAHVHRLEQLVIDALGDLGVGPAQGGLGRHPGYPGVWLGTVDGRAPQGGGGGGAHADAAGRRRRTLHGVAVNVDCDLSMFGHIVPCGICDLPVTSLAAEGLAVSMDRASAEALVVRALVAWGGPGTRRARPSSAGPCRPAGAGRLPASGPRCAACARPGSTRRRAGRSTPASRRGCGSRPAWGADYLGLGPDRPRPRPGDGVRGGGLPQHLRVLGGRHGHFHGQRVALHSRLRLLSGRHPPARCPSTPASRSGWPRRWSGCGSPTPWSPAWPATTCPTAAPGALAATVEAIRRPPTRHHGRGARSRTARATARRSHAIFDARPDVLNHNIETVARLQRAVRPSAGYARSLSVLARAADAGLAVKSGLMVGLGEPRTRSSPPWPTCGRWGCPSPPSGSTCGRAPPTSRWPAGGRPPSSSGSRAGRQGTRVWPTSRRRRSPAPATTPARRRSPPVRSPVDPGTGRGPPAERGRSPRGYQDRLGDVLGPAVAVPVAEGVGRRRWARGAIRPACRAAESPAAAWRRWAAASGRGGGGRAAGGRGGRCGHGQPASAAEVCAGACTGRPAPGPV